VQAAKFDEEVFVGDRIQPTFKLRLAAFELRDRLLDISNKLGCCYRDSPLVGSVAVQLFLKSGIVPERLVKQWFQGNGAAGGSTQKSPILKVAEVTAGGDRGDTELAADVLYGQQISFSQQPHDAIGSFAGDAVLSRH